jgi:GDSL-like lipase/acylhydrolase family protein
VNPLVVRTVTGRADLPFRVNAVCWALGLFLLALTGAALMQGRARRVFVYATVATLPLAIVAMIEAAAIAVRLADRIAPIEDMSLLQHEDRWPGYLRSDARWAPESDGLRLYRPWRGDGISINEVGLRMTSPQPKTSSEWRIGVTGGSTVWGWRVLDADTIPSNLESIVRSRGRANVSVFNLGIEGARIDSEIALVKRFHEELGIDEVVFYTGGNDVVYRYWKEMGSQEMQEGAVADLLTFELVRTAARLRALLGPSPALVARLDGEVLPRMRRTSSLRQGIETAADYCRTAALRCEFALQPTIFGRRNAPKSEVALRDTIERVYPRLGAATLEAYGDAVAAGTPGDVHDLSDVFDDSAEPFFLDLVHLNEAGNRLVADRLARIVDPALR